ncbi:phage tail tape measure protein [Lactococcus lactis subsp. lactis]|uniref:Phage TMP n=6 Tax=Lactococcus lactis TaxID=1358 RepID=A0A1V0NI61_LACLL|nr:phage tail tape measure protein [Lactococcus lactis]MRL88434.1 phage tail tape measure protein [Lactococcus cremoris]DAP82719.1 MAG TPA: minor tail protein [Caudoviricetes sp.]ADZ64461.1 minor tail protein GP26-like protein [Lactococcus lactis subsp. lactis CV56]ARD99628.1 Phage TMP [Lactococcus lactis subsp. lactis]KAF0952773.1 phage tail tape measure protein [Lactococcus lactis subsp. lactis]
MESFSVQAYLKATDNNFVSTFKDAAKQVQNFQKNTNSTMSAVGQVSTSAGKTLTKAVTLPIVGIGVAAAKIGGDFESQMSRVKAISGATGSSFDELRQQAIDLGAKTAFSAKESAAGMENLASAGFDSKEIMKAMPGLLDLAAVSGGDVALASENAATALRGFNIDAGQSGHVADVFARAAADTNAEVGDMGEAMKYIAPVASSMGMSLEETAAAIGIMSDAGIKGSQAGTSLRGALSRLAKPTDEMQAKMDELGLSFYDSEGKMKPLKDQIGMLKDAFKGLTPEQQQNALVTLYGQESLSGMMALIDKGPDKLGKLTESLKNSDGAADKMAKTMQDNMNSSLEQMMGALESAAIVVQKVLAPAVRKVADAVSGLVDKFVSAPEPVQKMIVTIGLIVAAIGPLLVIFGQAVLVLQRVKVGFLALRSGLALIGSGFTAISLPVLGIIAAIAAVIAIGILVYKNWDKISKFGKEVWGNVKKFASDAAEAIKEKWGDITKWFSDTWNNLKNGAKGLWDGTIQGAKDAVDSVKNAWNGIKEWFANLWKGTTSGLASAWDSVTTTLAPFVETIKTIFQPILDFFSGLWGQVQTIFGSAWEIIKTVVMGPVLLLIDLITGDFNQFKEDFAMLWQTLATAIQTIVQTFVNIVVGFYKSFFQTVVNIWNAIVDGVKSLWGAFTTWVVNMAKSIVDGIVNGWNSFKQGTVDLWNATIQWVKDTWASFKQWVVDSANAIVNGVKQGWENLKQGTIDLWNGMINGLKGIWDGLKQSVGDLIDNVKTTFNNLKNINLLDIGKAIIDGLVKGLKKKWEDGMKFISGIGDWIRKHKGPIRVDRKLLTPAGNAIMTGLNSGLTGGFRNVQSNVSGMGDMIANAINSDYSVDIGANVAAANRSISSQVSHDVNLNQGKQPASFTVKLGNQIFKAFVDDISNAQGQAINLNMGF